MLTGAQLVSRRNGRPTGPAPARRVPRGAVMWQKEQVRISLPALAATTLTLTENGADFDVAPDRGTSGWIPRG